MNDPYMNESELESAEIRLKNELALIQSKKAEIARARQAEQHKEIEEKQKLERIEREKKDEEARKWIDRYDISIIVFNNKTTFSIKTDSRSKGNYYLSVLGEWNKVKESYLIPIKDGSSLAKNMVQVEKNWPYSIVNWGDSARLEAERQLAIVERVASLETADHIDNFTNHTLLKLRGFQEVASTFSESTDDRSLIVLDVGLGKTLVALERAEAQNLRTLIICPAKLRGNWIKQCKKITGKIPHCFLGSRPDRTDIKKIIAGEEQYYILTYESLRKFSEAKIDQGNGRSEVIEKYFWADALNLGDWGLLIADEIHAINNVDSHQSKAVRELHSIPKIILLSATPMKNRRVELFPILNLLDPKSFAGEADFIRLADNTTKLHSVLNKFMFRRSKAQVLKDLPPMERIDQTFDLSEKARRIYDRVEAGILGEINAMGEFVPQSQILYVIAKLNKLRQIVSYSAIEHTADLAIDLYNDAVDNDHPKKKIIIFSYYKLSVYEIAKRLGSEAIAFTGEDKDPKTGYMSFIEQFQNDDSKHFLVMQLMTGGEGFDITEAENVIFNDMWWTPAAHEQAEGRCYGRLNDLHGAKSFWMMAVNTISEMIGTMLQNKLHEIETCIDGATKDRLRTMSIAKEIMKELKNKRKR